MLLTGVVLKAPSASLITVLVIELRGRAIP